MRKTSTLFLALVLSITACQPPQELPPQATANRPACFVAKGVPFTFMPDGKHILYKDDSGIQIVDPQARQSEEFLRSPAPTGLSNSVAALSPAGNRLALALSDNTIRVFQVSGKKLLHTLSGHTDSITELEFSPDGAKLYSASHDTWVRVWDRDGQQLGAFQPTGADGFPSQVLGMGISADGRMLATIPMDGKTKIWDAETFALIRELGAFGGYDHSDAVFSPDGRYLAAMTANGLFLWRVADGAQLLGGNPGINAMALNYSPDGRSLAYWEMQGNDEINFLASDGLKNIRALPAGGMTVESLFFSPDHQRLVAASHSETRIWRLAEGELMFTGKPECP